jgi:hypothetical protein
MSKLAICLMACVWVMAQTYKAKPEKLPRELAPQPVAFSHLRHAEAKCADCHVTAAKSDRAGLPQADRCMLCHAGLKTENAELAKVAAMAKAGAAIKWVRAYRVPEYVFFSHREHLKAKLECTECHGPVATREVLAQEISTSMTACMNCHAARKVSNECGFCHSLGY